jgi:hypothetical protein
MDALRAQENQMKTLIDTNILYCLAGINKNELKYKNKLEEELLAYKPFVISELSILEIFTHKQFNFWNVNFLHTFIRNEQIELVNFSPIEDSIIKDFSRLALNYCRYRKLKKRAKTRKIEIESGVLPLVIVSTVVALGMYYDSKTVDADARMRLAIHLNSLIEPNIDFIKGYCNRAVKRFYKHNNQTRFKDEIQSCILMFLYILSINYSLSENGLLLSDLNLNRITDDDKKLLESTKSNQFTNIIKKKIIRKKNNGILSQGKYHKDLDKCLATFSSTLKTEFNPGIIDYYTEYIRKFLKTDFRFEKNNLIDSQFHEYDASYNVFTLDELLTESYRNIDPTKYSVLRTIQENVKSI